MQRRGRDQSAVVPSFRFGLVLCGMLACSGGSNAPIDANLARGWALEPALPEAVANNAVTAVAGDGGCMLFSISGIDASLKASGIHSRGFRWREGDASWIELPSLPGPARLASNAVGLRGEPYLLGGYQVADGGAETSSNALQRFDLRWGRWETMADLPIAIDDAGVAVWRDRYIVVVSGWSTTGAVDAVQIYDVESNTWLVGTAFPGASVFGLAMAIDGNELIVIDGVASGESGFRLVNQSWRGKLDPANPTEIVWTDLGEHPLPARYRAAAGALDGALYFHGGTSEPYNYDGLRYDNGAPSTPLATTMRYQEGEFSLDAELDKPEATMDHRALASCGDRLFLVGGMTNGPAVTSAVWSFKP